MFGSTSTNSSRKELIILITPHVVQSLDEATTITEQFKGKLQELKRELKQKDQFGDN